MRHGVTAGRLQALAEFSPESDGALVGVERPVHFSLSGGAEGRFALWI
jgi:hypothetical protein